MLDSFRNFLLFPPAGNPQWTVFQVLLEKKVTRDSMLDSFSVLFDFYAVVEIEMQ